jgi:hypothetical protein
VLPDRGSADFVEDDPPPRSKDPKATPQVYPEEKLTKEEMAYIPGGQSRKVSAKPQSGDGRSEGRVE